MNEPCGAKSIVASNVSSLPLQLMTQASELQIHRVGDKPLYPHGNKTLQVSAYDMV
jgi:hypothetical protein